MNEVNLAEAFSRYNVKAASRARSAVTPDRSLVLSCSYGRFHRASPEVLTYEEDLAGDAGVTASLLRTHLADALENGLDVRLIIAIPVQDPPAKASSAPARPPRTSFHARKDLIGQVTFFDGQRFVVEFRKNS